MDNYNTIFDDVFRTMLERMPGLIIPVINEVFQTAYSEEEKVEQYRNEHHTLSGEVITDSYLGIGGRLYHVECQSTRDNRMSIRMIEYDFAMALECAEETGDTYEINFPHSCVLYLRHDKNTPEHLKVRVNMPDGAQVVYQVPAVKVQDYTRDDIFEKKLLFFLPFYIMRHEKELPGIGKNPQQLEKLVGEFEDIRIRLAGMLVGENKGELYVRLVELIKQISDYMLQREKTAQERIGEVMGGKVLELEVDKIIEGRQRAEENFQRAEENFQRAEGLRRESVRCMLEAGEPEEKIRLYSGFSQEEIEQIKETMERGMAAPEQKVPGRKGR